MGSAFRVALIALGFAHRAGCLEGLGNLVVQFDAISHDHKCPVAGHFSENLLTEEHHRETLAAALRLPEHASAAVTGIASGEYRGNCVVDAEELVILADD